MIVARCNMCNFVARYNSNYFAISELQRHVNKNNNNYNNNSEIVTEQQGLCDHQLDFKEEKNS